MNEKERQKRIAFLLAEEAKNEEGAFWLSFCDDERPKGKQFLGVCVVNARGIVSAVQKAHDLGINPGGQVMCIPTEGVLPEHFDRLLSEEDLLRAGYIEDDTSPEKDSSDALAGVPLCPNCSGSGEGMSEGSRCSVCAGRGTAEAD